MEEPRALNQVAEFHKTFKHPVVNSPAIPSKERCSLRVALLAGAILEFGLGEKFKTLFDEVHRSNMSKACQTIEEADDTVSHYKQNYGSEAYL